MSQPVGAVEVRPARSAFVTAVAWVFIVLAGFATLISILQNVMIAFMFSAPEMNAAMEQARTETGLPWFFEWMFRNVRVVFFAFFLVCATTLASAVGLLLRKDWARQTFVGLMMLGILWNIGGVVLAAMFVSSMPPMPADAPSDFNDQFQLMSKVMIAFNFVIAVLFSVLFGWIARRLLSPEIRAEFS